MKNKFYVVVAAGSIALGAIALVPGVSANGCHLTAANPTRDGALVTAKALRGFNCVQQVTLTSQLRKQRSFQPDDVLAQNSALRINGNVTASANHAGQATFRTRATTSDGGFGESGWVVR